jgi:hypothetical protein
MVFGVLIRVILKFTRRRGLLVPGPSRLRLRGRTSAWPASWPTALTAPAEGVLPAAPRRAGEGNQAATVTTSPAGSVPVRTVAPRPVRDHRFLLPNGPWFPAPGPDQQPRRGCRLVRG